MRETPSPSQTFFRNVEIAGSDTGSRGPEVLASATPSVHDQAGQMTTVPASAGRPVRWLRLTLSGGLDIQRDKTFFEFSEIIGPRRAGGGAVVDRVQRQVEGRGCCWNSNRTMCASPAAMTVRAISAAPSAATWCARPASRAKRGSRAPLSRRRRRRRDRRRAFHQRRTVPVVRRRCRTEVEDRVLDAAGAATGCGSIIHGINFDFDSATIRAGVGETAGCPCPPGCRRRPLRHLR